MCVYVYLCVYQLAFVKYMDCDRCSKYIYSKTKIFVFKELTFSGQTINNKHNK